MKTVFSILTAITILFCSFAAFSAVAQILPDVRPSWYEHVDLMSVLVYALALIVAWFAVRTLRNVETKVARLFHQFDEFIRVFYTLLGEHNARTGQNLSCSSSRNRSEPK